MGNPETINKSGWGKPGYISDKSGISNLDHVFGVLLLNISLKTVLYTICCNNLNRV